MVIASFMAATLTGMDFSKILLTKSKEFHWDCARSSPSQASCFETVQTPKLRQQTLQAKLGMRAQAHQLKAIRVGNPVDQYQIGPDVAIPMVTPSARKRMILETFCQRLVIGESLHDIGQITF